MNISIGGYLGSGKTTVSNLLSKKLGMKYIYSGAIMREIAKKRGMSLVELQERAKTDPSIDKEVDARQIEIGKHEDNYLVEGQLAYYFVPKSIKICLKVSEEEAARRVYADKSSIRKTETYNTSYEETLKNLRKRKELTRARWKEVYGTDFLDESNFDLVIDTTNIKPEEVVQKIINFIDK